MQDEVSAGLESFYRILGQGILLLACGGVRAVRGHKGSPNLAAKGQKNDGDLPVEKEGNGRGGDLDLSDNQETLQPVDRDGQEGLILPGNQQTTSLARNLRTLFL